MLSKVFDMPSPGLPWRTVKGPGNICCNSDVVDVVACEGPSSSPPLPQFEFVEERRLASIQDGGRWMAVAS